MDCENKSSKSYTTGSRSASGISCVGSDGDATSPCLMYSLFVLKNAVSHALPDVEMTPKECLVEDHAANEEAGNAVKGIKKKCSCLEELLGRKAATTCSGRSSHSHMVTGTRCKLSNERSYRTRR